MHGKPFGVTKKFFFIPDDPYEIVFNFTIGDLCELDAMYRLEKQLKILIRKNEILLEKLYHATMSEATNIIIDEIEQNRDKPEVEPFGRKKMSIFRFWRQK